MNISKIDPGKDYIVRELARIANIHSGTMYRRLWGADLDHYKNDNKLDVYSGTDIIDVVTNSKHPHTNPGLLVVGRCKRPFDHNTISRGKSPSSNMSYKDVHASIHRKPKPSPLKTINDLDSVKETKETDPVTKIVSAKKQTENKHIDTIKDGDTVGSWTYSNPHQPPIMTTLSRMLTDIRHTIARIIRVFADELDG